MNFKYIIAVVQPQCLERLEHEIANVHVGGITLTHAKGFGGYKNFFSADWLSDRVRLEILVEEEKVPCVLDAIVRAAGSSLSGAGMAAVLSVDAVLGLHRVEPPVGAA